MTKYEQAKLTEIVSLRTFIKEYSLSTTVYNQLFILSKRIVHDHAVNCGFFEFSIPIHGEYPR